MTTKYVKPIAFIALAAIIFVIILFAYSSCNGKAQKEYQDSVDTQFVRDSLKVDSTFRAQVDSMTEAHSEQNDR